MRKVLNQTIFYGLVGLITLVSVFPFYYAIVSSFRKSPFVVAYLPQEFDWSNYVSIFLEQPFGLQIINSLIVFLITAAVVYFVFVAPMNHLAERRKRGIEPEPEAPSDLAVSSRVRPGTSRTWLASADAGFQVSSRIARR